MSKTSRGRTSVLGSPAGRTVGQGPVKPFKAGSFRDVSPATSVSSESTSASSINAEYSARDIFELFRSIPKSDRESFFGVKTVDDSKRGAGFKLTNVSGNDFEILKNGDNFQIYKNGAVSEMAPSLASIAFVIKSALNDIELNRAREAAENAARKVVEAKRQQGALENKEPKFTAEQWQALEKLNTRDDFLNSTIGRARLRVLAKQEERGYQEQKQRLESQSELPNREAELKILNERMADSAGLVKRREDEMLSRREEFRRGRDELRQERKRQPVVTSEAAVEKTDAQVIFEYFNSLPPEQMRGLVTKNENGAFVFKGDSHEFEVSEEGGISVAYGQDENIDDDFRISFTKIQQLIQNPQIAEGLRGMAADESARKAAEAYLGDSSQKPAATERTTDFRAERIAAMRNRGNVATQSVTPAAPPNPPVISGLEAKSITVGSIEPINNLKDQAKILEDVGAIEEGERLVTPPVLPRRDVSLDNPQLKKAEAEAARQRASEVRARAVALEALRLQAQEAALVAQQKAQEAKKTEQLQKDLNEAREAARKKANNDALSASLGDIGMFRTESPKVAVEPESVFVVSSGESRQSGLAIFNALNEIPDESKRALMSEVSKDGVKGFSFKDGPRVNGRGRLSQTFNVFADGVVSVNGNIVSEIPDSLREAVKDIRYSAGVAESDVASNEVVAKPEDAAMMPEEDRVAGLPDKAETLSVSSYKSQESFRSAQIDSESAILKLLRGGVVAGAGMDPELVKQSMSSEDYDTVFPMDDHAPEDVYNIDIDEDFVGHIDNDEGEQDIDVILDGAESVTSAAHGVVVGDDRTVVSGMAPIFTAPQAPVPSAAQIQGEEKEAAEEGYLNSGDLFGGVTDDDFYGDIGPIESRQIAQIEQQVAQRKEAFAKLKAGILDGNENPKPGKEIAEFLLKRETQDLVKGTSLEGFSYAAFAFQDKSAKVKELFNGCEATINDDRKSSQDVVNKVEEVLNQISPRVEAAKAFKELKDQLYQDVNGVKSVKSGDKLSEALKSDKFTDLRGKSEAFGVFCDALEKHKGDSYNVLDLVEKCSPLLESQVLEEDDVKVGVEGFANALQSQIDSLKPKAALTPEEEEEKKKKSAGRDSGDDKFNKMQAVRGAVAAALLIGGGPMGPLLAIGWLIISRGMGNGRGKSEDEIRKEFEDKQKDFVKNMEVAGYGKGSGGPDLASLMGGEIDKQLPAAQQQSAAKQVADKEAAAKAGASQGAAAQVASVAASPAPASVVPTVPVAAPSQQQVAQNSQSSPDNAREELKSIREGLKKSDKDFKAAVEQHRVRAQGPVADQGTSSARGAAVSPPKQNAGVNAGQGAAGSQSPEALAKGVLQRLKASNTTFRGDSALASKVKSAIDTSRTPKGSREI